MENLNIFIDKMREENEEKRGRMEKIKQRREEERKVIWKKGKETRRKQEDKEVIKQRYSTAVSYIPRWYLGPF